VIAPDNTVSVRTVTLGKRIGNRWIVEKGLQPGDRVVVDSPSLKEGTLVSPHAAPAAAEAQ
jgi:membrane fusion protein (multidrug efflux system)